jgi:hypothetical protein
MSENSLIISGALIAGAILIDGYWGKEKTDGRYQLSAAGANGQTVWRLDTKNGSLSMCGSITDGASFSAMEAQNISAMMNLAKNPSQEAQTKTIQDVATARTLADPRCTDWMKD